MRPFTLALAASCAAAVITCGSGEGRLRKFEMNLTLGGRAESYINGNFPGYEIRVNKCDTLQIKVRNINQTDGTTLHLHGLHFKNGANAYDGPGYATQCPIPVGGEMVYKERVLQTGTFFYHGHHSFYATTFFGALIVEGDEDMIASYPATNDRTLLLIDAWDTDYSVLYHKLMYPFAVNQSGIWYRPSSSDAKFSHFWDWIGDGDHVRSICSGSAGDCDVVGGVDVINVQGGEKMRLRVIAAGALHYLVMKIGGLNMTIVEVDGVVCNAVTVNRLELSPGQRYSVLVDIPSASEAGNYIITTYTKWRGLLKTLVARSIIHVNGTGAAAVSSILPLPLWGGPDFNEEYGNATLNINVPLEWASDAIVSVGNETIPAATRTVVLAGKQMFMMVGDEKRLGWAVNEHYTTLQPYSILEKWAHKDFPGDVMNLIELQQDEVVDIVFQNTVATNGVCEQHPWHVHGRHFYDMGGGPGEYNKTNHASLLRNTPSLRDTVVVYPYSNTWWEANVSHAGEACGWKLIRVVGNNPGVWMVHCHIHSHHEMGMAAMLKVNGPPGWKPTVPDGLPVCHAPSNETTSTYNPSTAANVVSVEIASYVLAFYFLLVQ